jgi:hypothetical protein
VCSKIVSVAESHRRHVALRASMNNRSTVCLAHKLVCESVSNVRPGCPSPGTDRCLEGSLRAPARSEVDRIFGRKAFRSLGSCGVGAPHVERALARRAGTGQPGPAWWVKGNVSALALSARATVDNASPSHAWLSRRPERWRLPGHSWRNRRQTDSPLEAGDAGNG